MNIRVLRKNNEHFYLLYVNWVFSGLDYLKTKMINKDQISYELRNSTPNSLTSPLDIITCLARLKPFIKLLLCLVFKYTWEYLTV